MPVKQEIADSADDMDLVSLYPNTEPLLSDDIWKKFELDFPELSGLDDIFDEINANHDGSLFAGPPDLEEGCEIRNHDCMWAGHCGSKEHDEPRAARGHQAALALAQKPAAAAPKRTSLLKPAVKMNAFLGGQMALPAQLAEAPQTPPMSDDEEARAKPTRVLQILHEAISECDLDEDSDLCEYFEEDDEDVEVVEVVEANKEPAAAAAAAAGKAQSQRHHAVSDHSYHKDKNASMRMAGLGIETPSDSEEEIDVVSIGDKLNPTSTKTTYSLPTNPSQKDRRQIQRRITTAIGKNRLSDGKTAGAAGRRPQACESSKRKATDAARAPKRPRQQPKPSGGGGGSPLKRRQNYSSDSEPEPSEKRSLHNNMERQRRIDLRNAFEELRMLVPEVSKKERAAKVVILREAAQHCDSLGVGQAMKLAELDELRKHQEGLRGRLSQLRRSLAAKR